MDNEIYDDLDELPPPPRVDIPAADLVLMEQAARAIGAVRFEEVDGEGYANLYLANGSVINAWNPLVHSDDAFALMVKLGLHIDFAMGMAVAYSGTRYRKQSVEHLDPDENSATRRAITRAAAELGA